MATEASTETEPPPPAPCGVSDIYDLSPRCIAARAALGQPTGRWTPQCLTVAIRMAVVNRGWPASDIADALLSVASDRQTRSAVGVAEAGPWWDTIHGSGAEQDDDLPDLEARLADLGGRRVTLQAQARSELARDGLPLTRATVTRRAVQILDATQVPAVTDPVGSARRPRSPGRDRDHLRPARPRQVMLRYTAEEFTAIEQAARPAPHRGGWRCSS